MSRGRFKGITAAVLAALVAAQGAAQAAGTAAPAALKPAAAEKKGDFYGTAEAKPPAPHSPQAVRAETAAREAAPAKPAGQAACQGASCPAPAAGAAPAPSKILTGEPQDFREVAAAVERTAAEPAVVLPEAPATVRLSNTDVNRLTCQAGAIRDVVYSQEKGLSVSFSGRDAYLKFAALKEGGALNRVNVPVELFVTCGEAVYTIIAVPARVPAQTVRLSGGPGERARRNAELFGALPLERKVMALLRQAYRGDWPDSVTVRKEGRALDLFRDAAFSLVRTASVEGEGLVLREFALRYTGKEPFLEIEEKDFLTPAVARGAIAVALDRHRLKPGETARVFVVETTAGAVEGGAR